jgi:hypothetical protein
MTSHAKCYRLIGAVVLLSFWGGPIQGTGTADGPRLGSTRVDAPRGDATGVPGGQARNYLTGRWECGKELYFVRQDGTDVWWLNEDAGRARVFSGRLTGRQISGKWADVKGSVLQAGALTLQVITPTRLRAATSGFCSEWTKK